jgi:hypothetical protein
MIAQRFRSLGWVGGVATAACALYLISLQVASERGRLEEIDRKIAATHREIRQLQTELGTRASLRQLERWNGESLALSAPSAVQYLGSEAALASLDASGLDQTPASPPPIMMAVLTPGPEARPKPEPTLIAKLTAPKPAAKPMTSTDKVVQRAIAPRQSAQAELAAPRRVAMLDRSTIVDLGRVAASERQNRGIAKP